jgi:hypothetical protein
MNATHIARLEILAYNLEHFDELWAPKDILFCMEYFIYQFTVYSYKKPRCKTSCCVAGLAGLIPELREQGLITNLGEVIFQEYNALTLKEQRERFGMSGFSSGENAAAFFGLSIREMNTLFFTLGQGKKGDIPHTPASKATQIREIIANHPEALSNEQPSGIARAQR